MLTDTDRLNCIDKILSGKGHFKIERRTYDGIHEEPFGFQVFTIGTQHFYGDNIRDICDAIITGEYKDRTYYGKQWMQRVLSEGKL